MKSYSSREVKAILEANGWYVVNVEGDHWQFKHPIIKGRVTLTHPINNCYARYKKEDWAEILSTRNLYKL